jgi:hypothetical protein
MTSLQNSLPTLARIKSDKSSDWVSLAIERASRCFSEKRFKIGAAQLATLHPYAIDYIEQAPALVVFILDEGDVRKFSEACVLKLNLRDMMLRYALPLPLRLISGRALRSDHFAILKHLTAMEPEQLVSCIPRDHRKQKAWLSAVSDWSRYMDRIFEEPGFHREWALLNLRSSENLYELALYVKKYNDDFEPYGLYLSLAELKNACQGYRMKGIDYHEQAAQENQERARYVPTIFPRWQKTLDVAPFPAICQIKGFFFTALETFGELEAESHWLKYDLKAYEGRAQRQTSRLFSIKTRRNRVGTLEVGENPQDRPTNVGRFTIRKLFCDGSNVDLKDAAVTFVHSVNIRA